MKRSLLLAVWGALAIPAALPAQEPKDGSSILFLEIPTVQGASRFDQLASEAPASITVVTAQEISRHGWRTLAEIVGSVRGFFTTYDRAYTYVAARGFGRPGDFSNRVLLMLDGQGLNEPVYGGGAYGTESAVDVADIDRVEFIRGPGSSLYGAGAFFGVINVVTRRGRDLAGGRASLRAGSFGTAAAGIQYGKRLEAGPEFLVSGQWYHADGQRPYYSEFDSPLTHDGVAQYDRDDRRHLLAKLATGDFVLEGVYNDRTKRIPTASFGTLFNDPRETVRDRVGFLAATWTHSSADGGQATAALGYHSSSYRGGFPEADGLYDDESHSRWLNGNASWLRPLGRHHKLIGGGEYRRTLAQEQSSWKDGDPAPTLHNDIRTDLWAVFLQDEMRLGRVILNAGARLDRYQTYNGVVSPRAALVYDWNGGAVKLLYGQAFRAPSNFELYYEDGYSIKAAPHLDPERIQTGEAVLEQRLGRSLRGVLSLYQYRARDLITQVLDPADNLLVYQNAEHVMGRGVEAEVQFELPFAQGRASYAFQRATDLATGERLVNSPTHLVQLALSSILVRDRLTAGVALQAMSARGTPSGRPAAGFAVSDISLRGKRLLGGLGGSLGVTNLTNTRYSDPVGAEHLQPMLRQDGRQFRLALSLEF